MTTTSTDADQLTAAHVESAATAHRGVITFHAVYGYGAWPAEYVALADEDIDIVVDHATLLDAVMDARDALDVDDTDPAVFTAAAEALRSHLAAGSYSHDEHVAEMSGDL